MHEILALVGVLRDRAALVQQSLALLVASPKPVKPTDRVAAQVAVTTYREAALELMTALHKVGIYDLMQELADATDSAAWDIWLSILRHEGDPTWKLAPPRYVVYDEVKT